MLSSTAPFDAAASRKAPWEGLGGPVRVDRPNLDNIDPALDECCRREEERNRSASALRRTLQRFDVVAERERRRRNLVSTVLGFQGCRCCYDPNSDGTGDYRALEELRASRQNQGLEGITDFNDETPGARYSQNGEKQNEKEDRENANYLNESDHDEFDYLLDEDLPGQDAELQALEERRRAELEEAMFHNEIALQHGYGAHRPMHPMRVLKAAGVLPGARHPPQAVVLHLVDPDSPASASLDLYLEEHATKNARGTKFMRAGGRSTLLMESDIVAKVFPRLVAERDLPALVAIRDGVVINVCPQLNGLVEQQRGMRQHEAVEIVPDAVYQWLDRSGVLLPLPPPLEEICRIRPEEAALMDNMMRTKPFEQEERDLFDCGVAGCEKTYHHEHVGISNEIQSGMVVKEGQVADEGV